MLSRIMTRWFWNRLAAAAQSKIKSLEEQLATAKTEAEELKASLRVAQSENESVWLVIENQNKWIEKQTAINAREKANAEVGVGIAGTSGAGRRRA